MGSETWDSNRIPRELEFEADAVLVGNLEHAGSELAMDRQRRANYPACDSIESLSTVGVGIINVHPG